MSHSTILFTQILCINLQKMIKKPKINGKNTFMLVEPNLLAQKSSFFSSFSAFASLRNTFFFISSLLNFFVNFMYLSLVQIYVPPDISSTKSFISNKHQTISFSIQSKVLKNFSSSIKAIPSLTLQVPITQFYSLL